MLQPENNRSSPPGAIIDLSEQVREKGEVLPRGSNPLQNLRDLARGQYQCPLAAVSDEVAVWFQRRPSRRKRQRRVCRCASDQVAGLSSDDDLLLRALE